MPTPDDGPATLRLAQEHCDNVLAGLERALQATSGWVSPNAEKYEENLCQLKSKIQALADLLRLERTKITALFSEIPR